MKLFQVDSLKEAQDKLFLHMNGRQLATERLSFEMASGRILAEDVFSAENVPAFARSTVDGYAVCASDTAAATDSIPAFLQLVGQVQMGKETSLCVGPGQCVEVPTGGMLPKGASAVVMFEYCEGFGEQGIAVYHGVAQGENTVLPGEDIKKNDIVLHRGTVLGPRHIGALAAAGVCQVTVYCPLRLAILSTGDEVKAVHAALSFGEVHDINTHALTALAQRSGYFVVRTGLLADDESAIEKAVRHSMADCDVILISGGSSKGKKDATRNIIDAVAYPGVFTHGIAMKPGKPTILGADTASKTILGGLPGHPVAAMIVFEQLFSALYRKMAGSLPPPPTTARLSTNVAASPGMHTCLPVRLERGAQGWAAVPVFGKSGLITTLCHADGYTGIDRNREGLNAGETVEVHLF